jgi:hypothetical protein
VKIERKSPQQVNARMVRLTRESKKSLSGLKYLGESVASVIECGNWWIPSDSFLYSRIKREFEHGMKKFFDIPEGRSVEVKSLESDILSFDDGIYPNYN